MPNLVDYINSTNDCRKAIINKLNNKLNSFIPEISIDTPLSEIDERLNDFNITNMLINSNTYYVCRGVGQPYSNLNNLDPRLSDISVTHASNNIWTMATFKYISKYPIKAVALISAHNTGTESYVEIRSADNTLKYRIAGATRKTVINDNCIISPNDTITLYCYGGNDWNAIAAIVLNSIINELTPVLTLNNLNGSADLTANNIELTEGKYRIVASSGAGSGMESEDTYNSKTWYKAATGGNGSNIILDLIVDEPINISCICGKKGGDNTNNKITPSGSYSYGSKISGGDTIIKINNINFITLSGGKFAYISGNNSSQPGNGGKVEIDDLSYITYNILESHDGSNGTTGGGNTVGATATAIANTSNILIVDGDRYGYAGSMITGGKGINPTGGYISISKFKE